MASLYFSNLEKGLDRVGGVISLFPLQCCCGNMFGL